MLWTDDWVGANSDTRVGRRAGSLEGAAPAKRPRSGLLREVVERDQVAQRGAAVGAIPRLVEARELRDELLHLGVLERRADHHGGAARAHREHGAQLGKADVLAGCLGEQRHELVHIARAEDSVLGEGQRQQAQPLRGRRALDHLDLEAVSPEDVQVVEHGELVGGGEAERQRRDEALRVDLGGGLQRLEAVLLVGGVLVDDEEVRVGARAS